LRQFLLVGEEFEGGGNRGGASSSVGNALMLFSVSIVNVILNLLFSALCAVTT
jgi:hypothetical protein